MPAKKTLYVANPYGFSAQQRDGPLQELVGVLESLGADVWEPFARNNQIDRASAGWAYRIGQADLRDVREADGLFAVVNGCPPDEGVMVELGMAIAWEKPVFLFRDDFRRCTDSEVYPLNLMLFTGLPADGWEAAWYGSLEEIADPGKALARWLRRRRSAGAAGSWRQGTIVRAGWRTRASATRPSLAMAFAPGVQRGRGVRSSLAVRSSIG